MKFEVNKNAAIFGEISHIDAYDGVVVVSFEENDKIFEHYFPGKEIENDLNFKFITGHPVRYDYIEDAGIKIFNFGGCSNILQLVIDDNNNVVDYDLWDIDEDGNPIENNQIAVNDNTI